MTIGTTAGCIFDITSVWTFGTLTGSGVLIGIWAAKVVVIGTGWIVAFGALGFAKIGTTSTLFCLIYVVDGTAVCTSKSSWSPPKVLISLLCTLLLILLERADLDLRLADSNYALGSQLAK